MVQYKGRTITDFFKIHSQTLPQKRPFSNDGAAEDKPQSQRHSSSLSPLPTSSSSIELPSTPLAPKAESCHNSAAYPTPEDNVPTHPIETSSKITVSFEPLPTQNSTLPSSQRIIKNGEVMIRNSDDEVDSDSSLEDLDAILSRQRAPSGTPEPKLPYLPPEAMSVKAKEKGARRRVKLASSPLPVRTASKFSLQELAKQKREYEASKEDIAKTKDLMECQVQNQKRKNVLDADLIDEVMQDHGETDDINRLKTAIQRTEALHHDHTWSFFNANVETKLCDAPDFSSLSDENLGILLFDKTSREQTFLSGFMDDIAKRKLLPEELLLWILDSSYAEPRDDLRQAYASTLREASEQLTSILSVECVDAIFQKIRASKVALQVEKAVEPRGTHPDDLESKRRPDVLCVVDLLGALAHVMSTDTRTHAISLLCRL
ncbi:MAG: hypothetical protein Q9164_002565, partial [Protoblastenia rupestris]